LRITIVWLPTASNNGNFEFKFLKFKQSKDESNARLRVTVYSRVVWSDERFAE